MLSFKTLAVALFATVATAHPFASPIDAPLPDKVQARAAFTSSPGTTSSTLSCPGSNSTTFTTPNGVSFVVECGFDRPGNINMVYTSNFATCLDACATYSGCVDVSWVSNGGGPCYMKSSIQAPSTGNAAVWGARVVSGNSGSTTSSSMKPKTTTTTLTKGTTTTTTKSTKTSTSPTPTTTSSGTPTTPGKRGLAYNTPSAATLFPTATVTWGYNWGQTRSGLSTNYEYVPMLWGSGAVGTWNTNAKAAIASGSKYLLGFNEPDLSGSDSSNIAPAAAAALWLQYMQPFASSAKLVSPAVSNGGGETGLQWLKEFFGNCTTCTVDSIAIHWYSDYAPDFQNHVKQAWTEFSKPIWVTEFGLTGANDTQVESFLESVMPWMDGTGYVQRYAYFGMFEGYLLNSAGNALSDYGQVYATYV